MTFKSAATLGHRTLRLAGIAIGAGCVFVLGLLGWQWRANATVGAVEVRGARHASVDTLRRLARVDSGDVTSDLDRGLVADRVERHPWVETAEVDPGWLSRTLTIFVTERTPAGLVVDAQGRPAFYVDETGHAMPLPDSAGYDVPLVRGLEADFNPVQTVAPPLIQDLFQAMPETDTEALVAEIELRPDSSVRMLTTPIEGYGALPVRLGAGDTAHKLNALRAFTEQVLPHRSADAGPAIEQIDLRFDGQVVTRDRPPG